MIVNAREILDRADIRDVLDQMGVQLSRNNTCACPVHQGKDKNFSVKNGYGTCFSQCGGKSWDAAELLIDLHGYTFPEAVEYLARLYSIDVKYSGNQDRASLIHQDKQKRERRKDLYAFNAKVAKYYASQLERSEDGVKVGSRMFSQATADTFHLGYAPDGNVIVKSFQENRDIQQELTLIKPGKHSGFYDTFRDRYIFPIHNHRGDIAGFSGRKQEEDDNPKNPKYLNSSESLVYNKSDLLYGLYQGSKAIRDKKSAYIVEGNTDVLSLHDHGIQNVVAPCGTAFTPEQARLLKRYTDVAILLLDGDDAGLKASDRSVEILLSAGFHVRIVLLPEDQDPDSYIRELGVDEFRAYLDESSEDALEWKCTKDFVADDIHKREVSIQTAATLIASVQSEVKRDMYINKLCKTFGSDAKKILKDTVSDRIEEALKRGKKTTLSVSQQEDIINYGIYERNNRYYESMRPDMEGSRISNFIVKPIILVKSQESSERLVEVINEYGKSFIKNIDSDAFVEFATFKKEVERQGNYLFTGKADSFIRIKSKIYDAMDEAYTIASLGYQEKHGFYAWANGIISQGSFQPVDEYGLVSHDGHKYFLPAFSKIYQGHLEDVAGDKDIQKFIYCKGTAPSVSQWISDIHAVFGLNGVIGAAYYFAALFRDLVYGRFQFFPHLNLFGPKGTGKSFLAWSLTAMFGKRRLPFNLHSGTDVSFFRVMEKVRNGLVWFDEYSSNIDPKRVQALKNFYDGAGRPKGRKSTDNRTITTQVLSAVVIAGQKQPVDDPALFSRVISLNFSSTKRTASQIKKADGLKAIEDKGVLSQLTSELVQLREYVEEHFNPRFDRIRSEMFTQDIDIRLINNYSIIATFYDLLAEKHEVPMSVKEFKTGLKKTMIDHGASLKSEDELAAFWRTIEYLLRDNQIDHDHDLIVEDCLRISLHYPDSKKRYTKKFDDVKRLMFLTLSKSYPKYKETARRQDNKSALPYESLKHYLMSSEAYVGWLKAKKFAGKTYSCLVFDMEKLDVEIPNTSEIIGGGMNSAETSTTGTTEESDTEELPF